MDRLDSREGFGCDELEAYRAAEEAVRQNEEQYCDEFSEWLDSLEGEEVEDEDDECFYDDYMEEHDGQPSEYEEWQDVYGGDVEEYGTYGDYDNGDY